MTFKEQLHQETEEVNRIVCSFLPKVEGEQKTVLEAMDYSLRAGGKRLRPMMIRLAYRMFGGQEEIVEPFMAGMEMIHTHSLVHDDLPAMDNDLYRRGKKTTHAVYGEAMAILAGDGLLNYAYETMTSAFAKRPGDANLGRALGIIAAKTGVHGMIGGQCVDVEMEGKPLTEKQLDFIYDLKTSALIEGSLMSGAALAGADEEQIAAMERIGRKIGLAFQIQDDLLDVISTQEELGKPIGSDERNQKTTFVSLRGQEIAQETVRRLTEEAVEELDGLSGEHAFLKELLLSLVDRRS